ncbi:FtsX-like permease family protein [Aeribacillus sp. FSL K6-2833]|uniref:FtsX-like permease family protein n=1 Tax=Aeribacillus sp. FSL K6-2833 TaxID=2954611 RepID=UPI0030D75C3F
MLVINYNEITILLDEKTAVDSKIFTGYKDLTIYLEDNISSIEEKIIDSLVYEMVASIPGSLYQKISTTQIEEMKISSYIGFLGKLSFLISLFLSMTSIISILLSKYYIKKRTWGIYLSLGMRKRFVMKLLSFEIFIYFFISIVISTILFFLSMKVLNHVYPTSFYTIYYIFAVLFILIIATLGVFVLSKIIKNQSILDLLRLKE